MRILLLFLVAPLVIFSNIEEPKVVSGHADFHQVSPTHLEITTQNSTIIDYKQFSIPENHKVKIIQPSAKSKVLNRVRGSNPSQILGDLESNGKVFLINPNGIFFGPNCKVDTGSLIASTLDIANDDFKKGKFRFQLSPDAKDSRIINQGHLTASLEGEIALLAPSIINEGVIHAAVGKIGYFAAPMVTLDLTGDHLVSFAVDGELEQGIIQHLGKTVAEDGTIYMRLSVAKKAIEGVINTEGLNQGNVLVKDNGVIRIVNHSDIIAKNVSIKGNNLDVSGDVKTTRQLTLDADNICFLNKEIDGSSIVVTAAKTHMKTGIHALEGMVFEGAVSIESPKVLLIAEGKSGVAFHDSLLLKEKLKIFAPEGVVSFNKVEGVSLASLDVHGKSIEVNQPVRIKAPVTLNGKIHLSSKINCPQNNLIFNGPVVVGGHEPVIVNTEFGKGDVIFNGVINGEGAYRSLTISTGDGSCKFKAPIGQESPLETLTVTSKTVEFQDIGGISSGILKKLHVAAKSSVDLNGHIYNTAEQFWGAEHFYVHKPIQIISNAHPIEFVRGTLNLKENTSLHINAGEGSLGFFAIKAAKSAPIYLTSGHLSLGEITAEMAPLTAQAKSITVNGNLLMNSVHMDAQGDIVNGLQSHKIISKGDVTLNSKKGSIGYLDTDTDLSKSRLWVKSDQKIYVGSPKTVNLEGDSIDKILHPIPGNQPSVIIFNDMESYQFMGEFFEDLEELLSSLAPHLFSKRRGDYIDTTIVNPRPAPLYYKP